MKETIILPEDWNKPKRKLSDTEREQKKKEYIRGYYQRPDVKLRRQKYHKDYYKNRKSYFEEYRQRVEVKKRKAAYQRKRYAKHKLKSHYQNGKTKSI